MGLSALVYVANRGVLPVYSAASRLPVSSGAISNVAPGLATLIVGGTSGSGAPIVTGSQISAQILVGGATSSALGITSDRLPVCRGSPGRFPGV